MKKRGRKRKKHKIHYRVVSLLLSVKPQDYEHITANWVARKLDITPEHLSRKFLEETGLNFQHFLQKQKVCWSVMLLQEDRDLKTRKLADIIGYNTERNFIRLFKSYMGTTPGRFQRMIEKSRVIKKCTKN